MTTPSSASFATSRWLFLRLMGVVYLMALLSLAVQVRGLVGEDGILPAQEFLTRLRALDGSRAFLHAPTLLWLWPSDTFLLVLCWGGVAVSLLLIAGVVPVAAAAALWVIYLSLTIAGQTFLEFQWDSLLLETGLLAVLYAPCSMRSRLGADAEPPSFVRWTVWLLAFKLTFLSGITKIVSGDATWANWTALTFHYETQPIPAWTSWFVHQLPPLMHYWSTAGMFAIELCVPWLIFLTPRFRRTRLAACALMTLLQLGIAATGNYGFFNPLTIVLYLSLLDDRALERLVPARARTAAASKPRSGGPAGWRIGVNAVAGCVAVLSVMTLVREVDRTRGQSGLFDRGWPVIVLTSVAPFGSINGYGLFRVMTTERPEIVIEVSEDAVRWMEWEFRWKAGDVMRRPRFVEPHMPRLDWQMWFAALGPRSAEEWLLRFVRRLLDGEPRVEALLGPNPLQGRPRYVRLAYYQYRFTSFQERAATGAWWKRTFVGYLSGPIEADQFRDLARRSD